MSPAAANNELAAVGEVFRHSDLPAVATLVNDLGSGRGLALRVITPHRPEPLDRATRMRALQLLQSNEIRPQAR